MKVATRKSELQRSITLYVRADLLLKASRLLSAVIAVCLLTTVPASAQRAGSAHPNWKNLAENAKVVFQTPPDYPETTESLDDKQLTDSSYSSHDPIWYDKDTVGWGGPEPVEFTVDLGAIAPIRSVALRVGAGKSGVGWPQKIEVSVSDSGEAFVPMGDLMKLTPTKPPATGYEVMWLRADALKTHGRFVKFVVTPTNTDDGVYFFLDEIEVYKGDDAFLKIPHPEVEKTAKAGSADSPAPKLQNIAIGAAVTFNTPPNDAGTNDPDDAKQLVDGKLSPAVPMWSDKSAIGWAVVCLLYTSDAADE